MTLDQLKEEGVSAYAGIHPCNQLSAGMFIRKDGVVQACPGNDHKRFRFTNDIREQDLKDIWVSSKNYVFGPRFNNKCVKDGITIPGGFYKEVLRRVEEKAL